jgi:hypothetical protein
LAGPTRPPRIARPAALLLVAALLAACTGGGPQPTSPPVSTSAGPSTSGAPGASGTTSPPPSSPGTTKPSHHPPARHAAFRFHAARTRHTLVVRKMGRATVSRATRSSARAIKQVFDALYRQTFVDPAHWRTGRYGETFQTFFGGQVRAVATKHLVKLTLGPDAGKRFERVRESAGRLAIDVLIGAGGAPVTASVHATFNEKAVRTNGGVTVVVSDGHFYLQPAGKRGWVIDAFRVGRHDHPL